MDILGSIMKNMVQPPRIAPEERERRKKIEEMQKKQREAEQNAILKFKGSITLRVEEFSKDEAQTRLVLEPMTRQQRGIVHEIAETNEMVAHSFGTEELDRHVIIFKADACPCEAELNCLKRGEVYVPREIESTEVEEESLVPEKRNRKAQPEYLQKYEKHLGGLDVAKAGAKSTETSRSYGYVSSEQKKDKRTIEETLADIQARKKSKTTNNTADETEPPVDKEKESSNEVLD